MFSIAVSIIGSRGSRLRTYVRLVVNAGDFEGGVSTHSPGEGERGRLLGETPKTEERQHCDLSIQSSYSCIKLYRRWW